MSPAALQAIVKGDMSNFLVASTPGGIEKQEKDGQIEQSFLETLPKKGTEARATWEALGFAFGNDADDIFVNVKFPHGWRKQVTDHDMWTKLLDDKGRERASIFYKAAFYDRSAHIHLTRRFEISRYDDAPTKGHKQVSIKDSGAVREVIGTYADRDYPAADKLEAAATEWLQTNYPNWKNVSAYWD